MKKLKNKITELAIRVKSALSNMLARVKYVLSNMLAIRVKPALCNKKAEGYVDTGLKILISVVIGTLLLSSLYILFGDNIMPTLSEKIQALFNYSGT